MPSQASAENVEDDGSLIQDRQIASSQVTPWISSR